MLTSTSATTGARDFDGSVQAFDGTIDEVLSEHFPHYVGIGLSNAILGGEKFGKASQWGENRPGSTSGPSSRKPLTIGVYIIGAVVVAILIVVLVLWGRQIALAIDRIVGC